MMLPTSPSKMNLFLIIFTMAFLSLPLLTLAPWWTCFYILIVILYRYRLSNLIIPNWIKLVLILLFVFILKLTYTTWVSAGVLIGGLLIFYWLKLIESKTLRDFQLLVIVGLFVIFSSMIIHQNLWIFIYTILATGLSLRVVFKIHYPNLNVRIFSLRNSLLCMFTLSLGFIFFFVFPRLLNPLWSTPLQLEKGLGFNDFMSVSNDLNISQSNRLIMRVKFNSPFSYDDLYWQGLKLSFFDGKRWQMSTWHDEQYPLPEIKGIADYEVLLEPTEKKWFFYLEEPVKSTPSLMFTPYLGLASINGKPVYSQTQYSLSKGRFKQQLPTREKFQALLLPAKGNSELKKWAIENYNKYHNTEAFIGFIQHYIFTENFWYKLHPTDIPETSDAYQYFWLNSKEGYCEFYAGAVAFILRAAGIPTLVNVGFFGGEFNPLGNYVTVRARHAHAWLSYWDDTLGWRLFDPTKYINPTRIDKEILAQSQTDTADFDPKLQIPWINGLTLRLEYLAFFLNRWLLFYNQTQQLNLFGYFGFPSINWSRLLQIWIAILISLFALSTIILYVFSLRSSWSLDWQKEFNKLQSIFQHFGLLLNPHKSLHSQFAQFANKVPKLTACMSDFLAQYDQLRLQKMAKISKQTDRELIQLMRNLRRDLLQKRKKGLL